MDTIATTTHTEPLDDDLFVHIRPAPRSTDRRITCRACSAFVSVPLDHPALLCPSCLADLAATRQRLINRAKAICAAWTAEWDAWKDAEEALTPEQRVKWEALKAVSERGRLTPGEARRLDTIANDPTEPLHTLLRLLNECNAERYADQLNAIRAGLRECEASQ